MGVGGNKLTAAPVAPFALHTAAPATLTIVGPAPPVPTTPILSAALSIRARISIVSIRARISIVSPRLGVKFWCRLRSVRVEAVQHVALVSKEVDGVVWSASDDPDTLRHLEALEQRRGVLGVEPVEPEPHWYYGGGLRGKLRRVAESGRQCETAGVYCWVYSERLNTSRRR